MAYPNKKTERIDTTVTEVEVRRGDTSAKSAAVTYVRKNFPECKEVLAVWMTGERGRSGSPVFAVEWAEAQEE